MRREVDQPGEGFGLMASGSSGGWDVDVDESPDGTEWWLDVDGPQAYLTFQLRDLQAVREAADFIQAKLGAAPDNTGRKWSAEEDTVTLGRFGDASVSLLWDNEDFTRCFLVVGPAERSALRLSLGTDDVRALGDALRQAASDLPQADERNATG